MVSIRDIALSNAYDHTLVAPPSLSRRRGPDAHRQYPSHSGLVRIFIAPVRRRRKHCHPVWLKNSAASRRIAIIVAQQPTQAIASPDLTTLAPKV